jgi:hypothetical protein
MILLAWYQSISDLLRGGALFFPLIIAYVELGDRSTANMDLREGECINPRLTYQKHH